MSSLINPFNFESHQIRACIDKDGEPMFVAADVCNALTIENHRNVLARLDEDEKGVHTMDTLGGRQELAVVNESGLYSLILTSRKPEAKRFKRWVTHEVLPSIRKTGKYQAKPVDPMQALNDPKTMRGLLLSYSEKMIALENKVVELKPKAQALEKISSSEGSFCLSDAAKNLDLQPQQFFAWLQSNRWIFRRNGARHWCGYQDKIKAGLLEQKISTVEKSDGSEKVVEQTRVTPRGIAKLAEIFQLKKEVSNAE